MIIDLEITIDNKNEITIFNKQTRIKCYELSTKLVKSFARRNDMSRVHITLIKCDIDMNFDVNRDMFDITLRY